MDDMVVHQMQDLSDWLSSEVDLSVASNTPEELIESLVLNLRPAREDTAGIASWFTDPATSGFLESLSMRAVLLSLKGAPPAAPLIEVLHRAAEYALTMSVIYIYDHWDSLDWSGVAEMVGEGFWSGPLFMVEGGSDD